MTITDGSATEQQARNIFRELFEQRDFSRAGEWWTDRSVDDFVALGMRVTGRAALERFFQEMLSALPDARMIVEHVVACDETREAVVQWRLTGTASGTPFQGIEATGRPIDLRGCDVIRLDEDGRVLTNTVYYDGAEFARQMGLLPERGSFGDRALLQAFNGLTRLRRIARR